MITGGSGTATAVDAYALIAVVEKYLSESLRRHQRKPCLRRQGLARRYHRLNRGLQLGLRRRFARRSCHSPYLYRTRRQAPRIRHSQPRLGLIPWPLRPQGPPPAPGEGLPLFPQPPTPQPQPQPQPPSPTQPTVRPVVLALRPPQLPPTRRIATVTVTTTDLLRHLLERSKSQIHRTYL